MENIVEATFITVWDDTLRVSTTCNVNMDTKEVTDIEPAEVFNVNTCTGQYVEIDDISYPVYEAGDIPVGENEFWYEP